MLECSNVRVYDLKESVIASRNAMRTTPPAYTDEEFEKSLPRAIKLVQASAKSPNVKCHDNFLVGIRVSFDVKYPQYWTPEFQRYHFADIVTSSSKMHRLLKMKIDESCNIYVTQKAIDNLQECIDEYNRIDAMSPDEICAEGGNPMVFEMRDGSLKEAYNRGDALYYSFMKCVSNCVLGLELFMRVTTNYKQLQTIYWQRKDHKLKEDWGAFIDMIKSLPYSKEFITGEID